MFFLFPAVRLCQGCGVEALWFEVCESDCGVRGKRQQPGVHIQVSGNFKKIDNPLGTRSERGYKQPKKKQAKQSKTTKTKQNKKQ